MEPMETGCGRRVFPRTEWGRVGLAPITMAFLIVVMVAALIMATAALGIFHLPLASSMFEGMFYFWQTVLCNLGVPA